MSALLLRFPTSSPGNQPPLPPGGFKWFPGHTMLSTGYDLTGGFNIQEFTSANKNSNLVGSTASYNWSHLEPTQGAYNIVNTIVQDLLDLNNPAKTGATGPRRLVATIKANGYFGTPMTSANASTTDGTQADCVPSWLIKGAGRLNSSSISHLQSTDGTMYTTSFPASPNPLQSGFTGSQWTGSAYTFLVSSSHYHPVAAQCFSNLLQAVANSPVPSFSIGGVTYPASTLNNHPLFLKVVSWDEESFGLGGGGGFLGAPSNDPNVFVNATGPFVGGVRFTSVLGGNVAGNSPVEMYSYRESSYINATKSAALSNNGVGGFTKTGVSIGLSFILSSGNLFASVAQLRTHLNNCYLGRLELNGQDLYGGGYGISYPAAVPWANPQNGVQNALNLFVGGSYANESNVANPGAFTPPSGNTPAPGGFNYRGKMPINGFIGEGDYSGRFPANSSGSVHVQSMTTNAVDGIWNSAQYENAGNMMWARCGNNYANTDWPSFGASGGFIYNSDGISVDGSVPTGVGGLTFNASQIAVPLAYQGLV